MIKFALLLVLLVYSNPSYGLTPNGKTSLVYNVSRVTFEGRYFFGNRFFVALNPIVRMEGADTASSNGLLSNQRITEALNIYGQVVPLRLTEFFELSIRGGVQINDIKGMEDFRHFLNFGGRLHFHPTEKWLLEMSSFPVELNYRTTGNYSSLDWLTYSRLNFAFGYLF